MIPQQEFVNNTFFLLLYVLSKKVKQKSRPKTAFLIDSMLFRIFDFADFAYNVDFDLTGIFELVF